ncbi:MAG: 16S rRNA processing protein RimM [Myxococcales bacterium]|nr:16S rRNA processing protein RimM [Myxococcales bacterium]
MALDEPLLHVGRVGRPHGIRGDLRVWPLVPGAETLLEQSAIWIADEATGRGAREYAVRKARAGGQFVILSVEGVRFRDQAEALKGKEVFITSADLPELDDPDEFYLYELQGLEVMDSEGELLGTVQGLTEAGTQDVLIIHEPSGRTEVMVPFVESIVVSVDLEAERVVVDLPEGLLEATRAPIIKERS